MISGIVTGKLFTDMIDMVSDLWDKGWEGVWDMVKGMWTQGVESFENAWNNPNPEEKWKFFGKIVGMILFEVVLAILTAGVGAAVSAAAKTSVLVTKLPKLVKVIDALTPEVSKYKVPEVDKDRLAKKADVDVKLKKINDDIEAKKNPKAKEFEKNVDDDTHKKLDDDARKEVDDEIKDDPKRDEKLAVLMAAKVIAEGADISGATITEVMAQLTPLAAVAGVRFENRLIVAPNYSIHMIGSDLIVDRNFSSGEKGKKIIVKSWAEAVKVVDDIIKKKIDELNRLFPNSQMGYRGSLATGIKYSTKGPFDPTDWDVDAFIVSDELAAKFNKYTTFRNGRDINGIDQLADDIEKELLNISGYRSEPNKKFTFRIWNEKEFEIKIKPFAFKLF